MQAFTHHTGKVLPIDRANVDTDILLPKEYLKCIFKFGYEDWLFDDFRYLDPGDAETPVASRRINPDFIINQPQYGNSSVLLARDNFGCGSSREHAVWALRDYGIRALIAPSFADIFYNNCFKNGLLPLVLPEEIIQQLFEQALSPETLVLTVDLEHCEVRTEFGDRYSFELDPARRHNLLTGQDEIAVSLKQAESIKAFEQELFMREPWLTKV